MNLSIFQQCFCVELDNCPCVAIDLCTALNDGSDEHERFSLDPCENSYEVRCCGHELESTSASDSREAIFDGECNAIEKSVSYYLMI